jgi:hypothetical protein
MPTNDQKPTYERREFLQTVAKRSAVLAGIVAAAHIPYKKPKIESFFGVKNAYAQATNGLTYTISGQVTDRGAGLDGVTLAGLTGSPVTAGGGFYTATVAAGFTGTATPTLAGYTFLPPTASYTNVMSNQTQDYATETFTISVTRNFDGTPGTAWNTGQDSYTFNCPSGVRLDIVCTVDAFLWPEIGLYAPGDTPAGTNLLTGDGDGYKSAGVGSGMSTSYTTATSGLFTLAIEDERVNASEQAGVYTVTITTTQALGSPTPIAFAGAETMDPDT